MGYLIQHLRAVYTAQRNTAYMQDTGFTAVPVQFRYPEWRNAVLFFLRHGLNFSRCVKARYDLARQNSGRVVHVHVNSLANDKYLPLYKAAMLDLIDDMRVEFETEQCVCRDYLRTTAANYEFDKADALRFTLYNESIPLSNLFRYCLAKSESLEDVVKHYEEAAIAQYVLAPKEYEVVWRGWIPPELSEQVSKLTGGYLHGRKA